ncbi:MAG: hypothetical protein BJ554DRAFT_4250, partial [Olpidium bornovanus]
DFSPGYVNNTLLTSDFVNTVFLPDTPNGDGHNVGRFHTAIDTREGPRPPAITAQLRSGPRKLSAIDMRPVEAGRKRTQCTAVNEKANCGDRMKETTGKRRHQRKPANSGLAASIGTATSPVGEVAATETPRARRGSRRRITRSASNEPS